MVSENIYSTYIKGDLFLAHLRQLSRTVGKVRPRYKERTTKFTFDHFRRWPSKHLPQPSITFNKKRASKIDKGLVVEFRRMLSNVKKSPLTHRFWKSYQSSTHSIHLRCHWRTFGVFTLNYFRHPSTQCDPAVLFSYIY